MLPSFVDYEIYYEHTHSPYSPPLLDHPRNTNLISINTAKKINETHHIAILTANIQSLNSNYYNLITLLDSINNPDILALTEIWNPQPPNNLIPGYQPLIMTIRSKKRGGGCGIFIKNNFSIKNNHQYHKWPKFTTFEYSLAVIQPNKSKNKKHQQLIITIYRPPGTLNIHLFFNDLEHLLELAENTGLNTIFTGDININLSKKNNTSKNYCNILHKFHLTQSVQDYTYYSHPNPSLLDHVISNQAIESHVINTSISDHQPIISVISNSAKKPPFPKKKFKSSTSSEPNIDAIKESLNKFNWDPWFSDPSNSDDTFSSLHETIVKIVKENTSSLTSKNKLRIRPKTPWITERTLLLMQNSRKLLKKYIRNNSLITYDSYLATRKECKKSIRVDKANYYNEKLENAGTDSRKIWGVINQLLQRTPNNNSKITEIEYKGQLVTDPMSIANSFNDFFKNVAFDLAQNIPPSANSPEFYLKKTPQPQNEFQLKHITESDILQHAHSFKSKSSAGFDNISNKLLKSIIPCITKQLKHAINKCFDSSNFPPILKTSKLTPLFKKGNPLDPANFRPISQVSSFSKLIEKISVHQSTRFHNSENVIPPNQFGFKAGHSTYHALLMTKHKIKTELAANNFCILISLDLSKCFDTIDIDNILPMKMKHFYRNEKTINYLLSYFQNRRQFVKVNTKESMITNNHNISCVQGSTSGPLTYSLYCSDLSNITDAFTVLFADDTNIIFSGPNILELQQEANLTLATIVDYMSANKLTLNASKTVALLFTPQRKKSTPISIKIGDTDIKQVKETRFLGIIIDDKLKFKTHFDNVTNKVKQGIGALSQTKKLLPFRAKIKIYHGLIHSHLSYCPLIWLYEQPMKNLKILEVLQKKAIRAIFCTKSNSHTTNLFSLSKIITVRNLCANDQLKIMYQFKEKLLPSAISNIIEPTLAITKNSRAKTNAHHRTTKNTGNFAFDMIHQWNKFDSPIKHKRSSLPTVKNSIKSYLQKLTESKCNKPDCHACLRTPPIKKLYDYMNPNNKL